MNHGHIARNNGKLFEQIVCKQLQYHLQFLTQLYKNIDHDILNDDIKVNIDNQNNIDIINTKVNTEFYLDVLVDDYIENFVKPFQYCFYFWKQLKKYYPYDLKNDFISIKIIDDHKVDGIGSKKTTSKSDLLLKINDVEIGISVKMTNFGTQLQIISVNNFIKYIEHVSNEIIGQDVIHIFYKFVGYIQPSDIEMTELNKKRRPKLKYRKRFWINELSDHEQRFIISFLTKYKSYILQLIYCDGNCCCKKNKTQLFLFNNANYSKTKMIDIKLFNYQDLLQKLDDDVPSITKNGNLQLNKNIGLQMKGSGNGDHYHNLQFKDRGYKKMIINK